MTQNIVNEPIDVIVHFDEKVMYPLRFKWREKVYKIKRELNRLIKTEGQFKKIHFSVMADSADIYEIVFDGMDFK